MNKRGFLLGEETIKIVIAVICIIFLVGLLASIYFKKINANDLELSRSSLDKVMLDFGVKSPSTMIYNPQGWSLSAWPYNGKSPKSCSNVGWANCICICKNPSKANPLAWIDYEKEYIKNCEDSSTGVCAKYDKIVALQPEAILNLENLPMNLKVSYYEDKTLIEKQNGP